MGRALPVMFELDDVRIASPCSMRWEDMTGGDKVRFCAACQKNVFNLSGMKRSEAQGLIQATEGKMCARFYRRPDGTILTADCPVGIRLVARRAKRMALGALATSLGAVTAMLAFLATTPMRKTCDLNGARNAVTSQMHRLQEEQSKLVVPEPPSYPPMAGGIGPPPVAPNPPAHPHAKPRSKNVKPVPPVMMMGDIAMPDPIEDIERPFAEP